MVKQSAFINSTMFSEIRLEVIFAKFREYRTVTKVRHVAGRKILR